MLRLTTIALAGTVGGNATLVALINERPGLLGDTLMFQLEFKESTAAPDAAPRAISLDQQQAEMLIRIAQLQKR